MEHGSDGAQAAVKEFKEFNVESLEAGPLVVPYLSESLLAFRTQHERLDRGRGQAFFGNCGYGRLAICGKG